MLCVTDHDGVFGAQLADQVLDTGGRPWVKRGRGFVHEKDFRVDGKAPARVPQPLLLSARKPRALACQAVFISSQSPARVRLFSTISYNLDLFERAVDAPDRKPRFRTRTSEKGLISETPCPPSGAGPRVGTPLW